MRHFVLRRLYILEGIHIKATIFINDLIASSIDMEFTLDISNGNMFRYMTI